MKRFFLTTIISFIICGLYANDLTNRKSDLKAKASMFKKVPIDIDGFENAFSSNKIADTGNDYAQQSTAQLQVPVGTVAGQSTYGLQTNRGVCRRVATSINETFVYATWTRSQTYNLAAPDRGTGYNFYNRITDVWQPLPVNRIEPTTRVGWPNIGFTTAGRQFSITHTNEAGMMFCYRDGNQSEWNETIVGNLVGDIDGVWARSAVDGEKIHVAIGRLGAAFAGVDGGVNYIRSLDNGESWESMGSFLPDYTGIYPRMGGDAYQIDAQDGNVAFLFGGLFTHTDLYLSTDDGITWERNTLASNSNPTVSYIDAETGFYVEPYWGSYGGNSVIYDSNNMPHVVFSAAFQYNPSENDVFGPGGGFFPIFESTALWYWNPTMAAPEIIGESVMNDANNDGALGSVFYDPINVKTYTRDMVGQPQLSIDENDNLYVSYAANVDGDYQPTEVIVQTSTDGGVTLINETFTTVENSITYKDVFLIKKQAGSNDWEGPINVTNSASTDDLYASIQRNVVDNTLYMIYQTDSLAGSAVSETLGHFEVYVQNQQPVVAIDVSEINDSAAPVDSEPYLLPIPWAEPFEIVQGCELTNDLFLVDYIVGMDYPDGFVPVELVGGIDYSLTGDYTEVLQAVDSQGNVSDTLQFQITIIEDTEAPTLEVAVPCNDFAIIAGSTWENPAVIISDNSNCDLYPLLQVQSSVDVNTIGEYTVVYNVTDYAGNAAEPLTLNVSVIAADTEGPEITFINAPETISLYGVVPSIDFLVVDNVDCEIADYTVEGLDDIETSIPGTYTITVTATDASGNTTMATHDIEVVDDVPPSIELEENPFMVTNCVDGLFNESDLPDDYFEVSDNYTEEENLTVNYDLSIVDCAINGEYEVVYTVTDEAGNIDDVTLTVIVNITSINDNYLSNVIDVFPNPTKGLVNVELSQEKATSIKVYNVLGKLVKSIPINNVNVNRIINLSNESSGVYFINVNTAEGSVTKKLTISK